MDEASRVIGEIEEQAAASGETFPLSDANLLTLEGDRTVISEIVAETYGAPIGSTFGQLARMYAEAASRGGSVEGAAGMNNEGASSQEG